MTQQYLVGEMSMLLARLQSLATDRDIAVGIGGLRQEAEQRGVCALAGVELKALELADRMCWRSLHLGDLDGFAIQAATSAQLREFGVCAGLLPAG